MRVTVKSESVEFTVTDLTAFEWAEIVKLHSDLLQNELNAKRTKVEIERSKLDMLSRFKSEE